MKKISFIVIFLFCTSGSLYAEECSRAVIFPLISKPLNDTGMEYDNYNWRAKLGQNQAVYESYRIREYTKQKKIRKAFHASRDLYTDVYNDNGKYSFLKSKNYVVAVADGKVVEKKYFYAGTDYVVIEHKTCDGRSFLIRYGELDRQSIKLNIGDNIKQGQVIGKPGFLHTKRKDGSIRPVEVIKDKVVFMLHLEYFTNTELSDLYHSESKNRYGRRDDIQDSLQLLEEGYKNSFGEQVRK